jgi:prophage regulatory protein
MQKSGNRNAAKRRDMNGGRSPPEPESTAANQATPRAHGVDERVKAANQLAGTARRKDQASAVLKGNASTHREPLKRTVRRHQLRQMVPLADTTIYEMEQRGEFPRRFYLTPRCAAWDVAEIESWIEERRRSSAAHLIKRAPSPDVRKRACRPVRR